MDSYGPLFAFTLVTAIAAVGCRSTPPAPPKPVLMGELTREEVLAVVPDWAEKIATSELDTAAARELAAVPPGGELVIYLGTWCGDSKREVSRFWRVLDEVGGTLPFTVRFVGVSREKTEPAEFVAGQDIRFVPTFIVRREGTELGRIVETPPRALEVELRDLFLGRTHGVLTQRTDLLESLPESGASGEP